MTFSNLLARRKTLVAVGVIIVCLLHLFVRLYGINAVDLDQDEVFTWIHSKYITSAWVDTVLDVHPPTYIILMSVWQRIFGDSESALRLLSVFFSLLTMLSLLIHSRLIEDHQRMRFAFFVSVLFLFLPYEIHLARYARSYAMVTFLCTAFTYCFCSLILEGRRFLALSILFGSLSIYTHFQAIFFVTSLLLSGFLCGFSRSVTNGVCRVALGIGFFCLPLIPLLPYQILVGLVVNSISPSQDHVSVSDFVLLFSPMSQISDVPNVNYGLLDYAGIVILCTAVLFVVAALIKASRFSLTWILLVQLILILILLYISPFKRIHDRSLCILIPPVIILLSVALAQSNKAIVRKMAILWIVGFGTLSLTAFPYLPSKGTDWKSAWSHVAELTSKSEYPALVVSPHSQILPILYLMSRGVINDTPPIWIESPSVLLSPWERKLDINVNSDLELGFWSTLSRVLSNDKNVSDIFILRVGILIPPENMESGFPFQLLKQFGNLSLYHMSRSASVWFTLFDPAFYLERNPDVAKAGVNPLRHFLIWGAREKRNPNPMFDVDFYLRENPDVAQTGKNPLVHFIAKGAREKRNPHPMFDIDSYLRENPDVAESGMNPLVHFLERSQKR